MFASIQVGHQRLDIRASVIDWARSRKEFDAPRFGQSFASFAIAGNSQRAAQLQQAHGVSGMSALGVAGRDHTDGTLAGDMRRQQARPG